MIDRKKIKKEYKETVRAAAVYVVINKENKRVFIGKTRTPATVLARLNFELERGSHPHKNMIEDYNVCGKNNFDVKIYTELDISKLEEDEVGEKLNQLYETSRNKLLSENYSFYNSRAGH
ncbi:MAG: GIY-YIG nuclease family protein [Rhodothermaceae bacterium]